MANKKIIIFNPSIEDGGVEKNLFIISNYLANKISDKEMTVWLTDIFNNGMNITETYLYTQAIIDSGVKITFNNLDGFIIDKHSTGGVGDKVSLILGPILAACGCYILPTTIGT